MADSAISGLTDGGVIRTTDQIGVERGGSNFRVTVTRAINAQIGVAYTLVLADAGVVVTMNNAVANTVTIPTNAAAPYPIGTQIDNSQLGVGVTTIDADTGVTLNGISGAKGDLSVQFGVATITKLATNTWIMSGNNTVVA